MHSLDPLIREVHVARMQAEQAKAEMDEAVRIAELTFGYTEKKKRLAELTEQLRSQVVIEYEADPDQGKTIVGGVKVSVERVYSYNSGDALRWAKDHNMFLALDKKRFDDFVKHEPLDFVTVKEITKARIPTDLSKTIDVLNSD
jgi:hypothetical protein